MTNKIKTEGTRKRKMERKKISRSENLEGYVTHVNMYSTLSSGRYAHSHNWLGIAVFQGIFLRSGEAIGLELMLFVSKTCCQTKNIEFIILLTSI